MEQVEIQMVRLELVQLLLQHLGNGLRFAELPHGAFGRQVYLLPVAVTQGLPCDHLALPVVVIVGRVHIVQALVDGPADIGDGSLPVDLPVTGFGQTHHAKAQGEYLLPCLSEISVFHSCPSIFIFCHYIIL